MSSRAFRRGESALRAGFASNSEQKNPPAPGRPPHGAGPKAGPGQRKPWAGALTGKMLKIDRFLTQNREKHNKIRSPSTPFNSEGGAGGRALALKDPPPPVSDRALGVFQISSRIVLDRPERRMHATPAAGPCFQVAFFARRPSRSSKRAPPKMPRHLILFLMSKGSSKSSQNRPKST